jgi:predicted ATPase
MDTRTDRRAAPLPLPLTSFVGREQEVAELRRLLTLTGPGGVGKTRLALELATSVGDAFADGVVLVELGALVDPELVPETVASAVGLAEQARRPLTTALLEFLRDRELLLILDNCEHLVQACAELAAALLGAAPGLRVLATSREPLAVVGETAWPVPSLSLPEGGAIGCADAIRRSDAVRLFIARARAVQADFRLDDRAAPFVAAICRRLDGLPLAIELAAARMRVLSVEDIAARLDDRFRLLTTGSRVAPPRQQTLRATVQWSYDLLSPPERTLLERLSVFAGSWTLEAAEAVCAGDGIGAEQVLDVLGQLVDKSLVLPLPSEAGPRRYRLQDSVRLFAQERLADRGELADMARRHARFFLELAEDAAAELVGPAEPELLARLEAEHDNLRAALRHLLATGSDQDAQRLGGALGLFWFLSSSLSEGRAWLEEVLALPEADGPTPARARCLFAAANIAMAQGDCADAMPRATESLRLWRTLRDERQAAASLTLVGQLTRMLGDYPGAEAVLRDAVRAAHATGNVTYEALALIALADMATWQGKPGAALRLAEEGLARATDTGRARMIVHALRALADAHFEQGDPDAAWPMPRPMACTTCGRP